MSAPAGSRATIFQLAIEPEDGDKGTYRVTIEATTMERDATSVVARVAPERLVQLSGPLGDAVVDSGHKRTALKATRKAPILLDEAAGVRVVLAIRATDRVVKPSRISRILEGVARLSDEECFYWYAHTVGTRDRSTQMRRLRAFRLFLTTE